MTESNSNSASDDKPSWFNSDLSLKDIPAETQQLLESYAHLPRDDQVKHVLDVREKAFARFPYPCIGQYRFLILTLSSHPQYPSVLQRIRDGATFLDVGACFGQDLRKLVADGAPSDNTYGFDIDGGLMEVGYDLFRDRDTIKTTFMVRDAFDPASDWSPLLSKTDVIHISAFFHLFELPQQLQTAQLLARFSRGPGTVILGRHFGSLKPGIYPSVQPGSKAYRHDQASFQALWDEAGAATATRWKVESTMDMVGLEGFGGAKAKPHWWDENGRRQLFTVTRLE